MSKQIFIICFNFLALFTIAQKTTKISNKLISGPMIGNVQYRDAQIWIEVADGVKKAEINVLKNGVSVQKISSNITTTNIVKFTAKNLDLNTRYDYKITIDGTEQKFAYPTFFKTKELWEWRKPAPDFSFLAGSCNYVNQPEFDRPGKAYGGDSSIFLSMAKEKSDFCLWLGDNWYTREIDYFSPEGMRYRASHDRAIPVLQPLLAAMEHFAIWDDHDYGPNDFASAFILKESSKKVFDDYWLNPTSGEKGEGIYTMIRHNDVEIFMLDDRWFRDMQEVADTIDGKVNEDKVMFGKQQMKWLENALLQSKAPFKIIATGSQVLNPASNFDVFLKYPNEYGKMLAMLQRNDIEGVLFFTGDRHHSEIIKVDRQDNYPLYDVTCSPLTSGTHKFNKEEQNNPNRVLGLDQKQNYSRITVSGKRNARVMQIDFCGIDGAVLATWSINERDLKKPRIK